MSAFATSSAAVATTWMPKSFSAFARAEASSLKRRLHTSTGMPNARARDATSWPMWPKPIRPSVCPARPLAFEYSFLFHFPARSSATLSGMRRSTDSIKPIVSSATATEFLPGQFET